MKSKVLSKFAIAFASLLLVGHIIGTVVWDKPDDEKMKTVVNSMKTVSAPFMGATKSMADYYTGNNILIIGFHLVLIFILWLSFKQINSSQRTEFTKILYVLAAIYLIFAIIDFIYFFPLPVIVSLITSITIYLTLQMNKKEV